MIKCKLVEPRTVTNYTFSEPSEFHGFLATPKKADLNSLPGLYREVEGRRLKVVMVESFPLFGTKTFVICFATTKDSNTPGLAVELVQMCRCQDFSTGFATESSTTSQSKTRNDVHLLLWKLAKIGSSKSSTNDFIRVSPNSSVTDVTKTPGSFVMFVLPAEIDERRHGEVSESANMSRPNLFNVLMKLSGSELYCILHGEDLSPVYSAQTNPGSTRVKTYTG